jgi:arylsulfatase A-like enzyme
MIRFFLSALFASIPAGTLAAAVKPNVLLILADDLGYGDVQCNNPERGKIPTPHLDRLAREGMRFTDGHSSSGVCSPSRYALLTGRYHWRTRLQAGIVTLWQGPLIAPDRVTIAGLARQHGYRTACIGKWHLGENWAIAPAKKQYFENPRGAAKSAATTEHRAAWAETFAQPIADGPTTRGFDEYFGTDVPNWPPYAFIENDRVQGVPSEFPPDELFRRNLLSLRGPALPGWKLEAILPALRDRAVDFIARQARAKQPFLLYLPLTTPHTPLAVNTEWQGKSGLGEPVADLIMETDAAVGRVLRALEEHGVAQETLVIFTSDNGFASYTGAPHLEAQGHFPSGPLRGYKTSAWEGGHRVPFLVRWPGVVKPGSVCDQLVHQADVMATLAEIWSFKRPDNVGEDSVSLLPLLKGGTQPVREHAISHSSTGIATLRRGAWKLITAPDPEAAKPAPSVQLYDLATDLGERRNLAEDKPELVSEMLALMGQLVSEGRSTRGAKQANDVPVNWRRHLEKAK